MLGVVSRELRGGEELLNQEIARLKALQELKELKAAAENSGDSAASYPEKLEQVREWNQKLADAIREKKIGPENQALWEHARQSLKEKLSVSNPRFSQD